MKAQKIFGRKINRKNFFYSLGWSVAGYTVMKSFPFNFIGRKFFNDKEAKEKFSVKINPYAVGRKKIGGSNGGR